MVMDTERLEQIFADAVAKDDPDVRAAYLDEACGADAALRARVEGLLAAHDDPDNFLQPPDGLQEGTVGRLAISEAPGTQIGPYKLMEQIGEGGFGLVFVAEQERPVRRKVALKVIKPGMDTREVIARFEAERQALAIMDHPNIAHVFDAGATDSGRPYFVMELVRGVAITDYCDQHRLSPRERLELFLTVCHAVQHAHQKGIIHRDIKPSNVLVTSHDGRPVVKVIDFGVAKAISGGQLSERTVYTRFAQMIGTPLYMSPEQAELSGADIDTRTDIYSLGVLLYELLTGTTPFDRRRLARAALDEVRRIVREEEPPKPSTRLSQSASSIPSIAVNRQTEPARLSKLVRGELDWIVMKALEKDRSRRYETANGLARDIRRYLNDESVEACPPTKWYRFRKLARQNRGAFAFGTAAALVVVLSVASLAVSNFLIRQEQARTKDEKERAEQSQQLAEGRAEEIRGGLERLKAANAHLEQGRWYVAERRWDDANAAFTKAVDLRPDHVAAWLERGDLFARLGLWDLARADFARAFELRAPDTTMRWFRYALLSISLGDVDSYRQVCRRMKDRFHGTLAIHFAVELVRTCALGGDPDTDIERMVELARFAADNNPNSWFGLYVLGMAHYRAGQLEQSVLRLQQSLVLPYGTGQAQIHLVMAMALHRQGQVTQARHSLQAAVEAMDHRTETMYQQAPGMDWKAVGNWPLPWFDWMECQLLYREAKLLIDGAPPFDDPRLHVLRARGLAALRRNVAANAEYAVALKLRPDDSSVRLEAHRSAGYSAAARKEWSRTAAEFTKASELAPDDVRLLHARAVALLGAGDVDGYRKACAALLDRFEKTADAPVAGDMVHCCVLRGDTLPDTSRLLPPARVAARLYHRSHILAAALYRAGKYDESIQCLEKAARTYRPRAWDWTFLAMAHHRLGHADEAGRCLAKAARWIDEANDQIDDDPSDTRPAWGGWHERIEFPLLLREARLLLSEKPGQ